MVVKPPQSTVPPRLPGLILSLLDALADQIHADLEIGDEHGAGLLQDLDRIADMVVVAMRQKNVGYALGRPFPALAP